MSDQIWEDAIAALEAAQRRLKALVDEIDKTKPWSATTGPIIEHQSEENPDDQAR